MLRIIEKVQVWDSKKSICLGWGEVVGIGVGCKKGISLIEVENKLIWGADRYQIIPEKKALEIAKRIEGDLK